MMIKQTCMSRWCSRSYLAKLAGSSAQARLISRPEHASPKQEVLAACRLNAPPVRHRGAAPGLET